MLPINLPDLSKPSKTSQTHRNNNILTTHFIEVCKTLDKQKNICNYHMLTSKKGEKFEYKYILKKGISKVKGGVQVLSDMNYPDEMIKNTIKKKKSNASSDPK